MKVNRITQQTWIAAAITILSLAMAGRPFMQEGAQVFTDAPYHLSRIEGIYLALLEGVFPVKVHFAAAYTYGYGTGFFYPDFFLYIPACLMLAGLSLETVWKIYMILVLLAAFAAMYYSIHCLQREGSPILCAVGAGCYVMCRQFDVNLYSWCSIGSATAMIFVPVAIAGLLRIIWMDHDRKADWTLIFGACGMLLSHLSTTIYVLFFLLLICIFSARRLMDYPRIIAELLRCIICGAAITIAFWLPMFEQLLDQLYVFETAQIYPVVESVLTTKDIADDLGYGLVVAIGAFVLLLVSYIVRSKHKSSGIPEIGMLAALGIASILYAILPFIRPFWEAMAGPLNWMQFASRIEDTASAGGIIALTTAICVVIHDGSKRISCIAWAMLAITFVIFDSEYIEHLPSYAQADHLAAGLMTEQVAGIGAGEEWLPDGASRYGMREPNKSYDPNGVGADGLKHDHGKYYEVYVLLDEDYYDVPYLYYKGYKAYLLDDAGAPVEELQIAKSEDHAYVRVYMPEGREGIGHIMVTYRKTTIQRISYVINVVTVFALFVYLVRVTLSDRKKRMENIEGESIGLQDAYTR